MNPKKDISSEDFSKMTTYLGEKYGLYFKPEKVTMLESRFLKRLNALHIENFTQYLDYVFSGKNADEYKFFIDLVTTHKTSFFREQYQFDYLKSILPQYAKRRINIWSAGCSTGEEVYTLGMLLNEEKSNLASLDYKIIGTDVSVPALKKAAKGTYTNTELMGVSDSLKSKYFKKTLVGNIEALRFNNAEITSKIKLGVLNLNNKTYNLSDTFDFIFCRNVIIYFSAETQKKVLLKLINKLKPGGLLFLGHSETAIGTNLPLKSIRPTIYQKL